jgi:ABC-type Fe3+ transport system permease subunit
MDELDKLKNAWKSQDYSKHKVSTADIYKMLHAKSSSYVKWIFYISIIEFLIAITLSVFVDTDKYTSIYNQMGMGTTLKVMTIISFIIMIVFIVLFYQNYKKIRVDSNARTLMDRIIKTRRTVKKYIYFNVGFMLISMFIMFYRIFSSVENTTLYLKANELPLDIPKTGMIVGITVGVIFMIGIVLLIYRLIYGILLKRLKKNYKELEQLEN